MKRIGIRCAGACFLVLFVALSSARAARSRPRVQLTNKLGVHTTVTVGNIVCGDYILEILAGGTFRDPRHFLLRVSEGVYVLVPLRVVRQAELKAGLHVVWLKDGHQLKGRLVGTLGTRVMADPDDRPQDEKKYNLNSATKIKVLSVPPPFGVRRRSVAAGAKPRVLWDLRVPNEPERSYSVSNPRFAFEYYTTSGYIMGGTNLVAKSPSFFLKVQGQEILANLSDFERAWFFTSKKKQGPAAFQAKVRAERGTETVGELVLAHKDDKGPHKAKRWYLVADIADRRKMMIAVSREVRCTLSRNREKSKR